MMVDDLIPSLAERGILAIGNHDGVLLPECYSATAMEIMEVIAYEHLGFLPFMKVNDLPFAISLLGAILMPQNLFLHSSLVLTRKSIGKK